MTDWRQMRTLAAKLLERPAVVTPAPPVKPPCCVHCKEGHWCLKWSENGWVCECCSRITRLTV